MTQLIGVFAEQGLAIKAIESLKEQGFSADRMRVIARNEDYASRVDSETDINIEKIEEDNHGYRNEEKSSGLHIPMIPMAAASPGYLGDYMGNTIPGHNAGYPAGVIAATVDPIGVDSKYEMRELGFNESDSKRYSDYLEKGHLLLLVDSDPSEEATVEAALLKSGASVVQ